MKKKYSMFLMVLFMMTGYIIFGADVMASEQKWNTSNEITATVDDITYNAYVSTDAKECWIYRIQVNSDKDMIRFPHDINGCIVTKIGGARDLRPETIDDDLYFDILGNDIDMDEAIQDLLGKTDNIKGFTDKRNNIKKLEFPDTLKSVGSASFVYFDGVEEVIFPDSVENIEKYAFCACTSLEKVVLPQQLKSIEPQAFYKCIKMNTLLISDKSSLYKCENNMLLSKNGKRLYYVAPAVENVIIPKGVVSLEKGSMLTSCAKNISIPATVKIIMQDALSLDKAAKVVISKKNKTFNKEKDAIYYKKNGVAACMIVDDGTVELPENVKVLNENISVLGRNKTIKKLIFPKALKKLVGAWQYSIKNIGSVCFKSLRPPIAIKSKVSPEYAVKPVFCKVYVPAKAKKKYIKWRLKGSGEDDIYSLWDKVIAY